MDDLRLALDPEVWGIVGLSFKLAFLAVAAASALAVPLGLLIAGREFRGKERLNTLINTLLSLPTVAIGLFVYLLLSRSGPLGGLGLLYTPTAIVIGQTILALPIITALTSGNLLEGSQRPDLIGDPSMPGSVRQRLDNYFNVAAFSRPAADIYGTAPRTLGYRTPGFSNADLTLGKRFYIRERDAIEFRLEAFNALNGVSFAGPNSSFGGNTFGQINDYASGFSARQLQLALRYDF